MNDKYWEEEIETMPREKLRELQLQRLKKTIGIAANSPYYKQVFQEHGITADSIRSVEDIRKIPFTTKADMRANYPFGLVAGNMHASTLPAEPQAPLPSLSIPGTTWTLGRISWHAACTQSASVKPMCSKTAPDTVCLPAD